MPTRPRNIKKFIFGAGSRVEGRRYEHHEDWMHIDNEWPENRRWDKGRKPIPLENAQRIVIVYVPKQDAGGFHDIEHIPPKV
jgi:hypothetical protein